MSEAERTLVVADSLGVSRRQMLVALIAGLSDPQVLADLANASMRSKVPSPEEALRGFFTDHHASIPATMPDNIDRISAQIATRDTRIEAAITPPPLSPPGSGDFPVSFCAGGA